LTDRRYLAEDPVAEQSGDGCERHGEQTHHDVRESHAGRGRRPLSTTHHDVGDRQVGDEHVGGRLQRNRILGGAPFLPGKGQFRAVPRPTAEAIYESGEHPSGVVVCSDFSRHITYTTNELPETPVHLCFTKRYDTGCYFNVRSKADRNQLNRPHGTND